MRDFYVNRYLRLYPIYFSVLMLTLTTAYIGISFYDNVFAIYKNAPLSANILLMFSNTVLFCQDWVLFSGIDNNSLTFTTNYRESKPLLYEGLIVPQAWTLGIELTFYLIAPFVLPKRNVIYVLLVGSICLRIYLITIGLGMADPWTYRFFPTELALFLLGSLAHQVLLPFYKKLLQSDLKTIPALATYFLIAFSLVYFLIPIKALIKAPILFGLFILLLPLTFLFQNNNTLDKSIGDLSYPIYMGHTLVIAITMFLSKYIGYGNIEIVSMICVMLSVGFAICLNKVVGVPFEKIRSNFRQISKPPAILPP